MRELIVKAMEFISSLPFTFKITVASLLLLSIEQIRKNHAGRIGIATGVLIVLQFALPMWDQLPQLLRWYTGVGVAFGAVGVGYYLTDTSLPNEYYKIAYLLYGVLPVLIVTGIMFFGL